MNANEYLAAVLRDQTLGDDSYEMTELRRQRDHVEVLLRTAFPGAELTIRYGGSKAKGTLIREAYDLDIVAYFAHGDVTAGDSLVAIYAAVRDVLATQYWVDEKTSALRLRSKEESTYGQSLHIDVVPGRFTDEARTDCYLHQVGGGKDRLKTNLDIHVAHVRESGIRDSLRLLKLFRVRGDLSVKQFVFELLAIRLLEGRACDALANQFRYVLHAINNSSVPPCVEDPANPNGNDLSPLLRGAVWDDLRDAAAQKLGSIDNDCWALVFGDVVAQHAGEAGARALAAPAIVGATVKPWAR